MPNQQNTFPSIKFPIQNLFLQPFHKTVAGLTSPSPDCTSDSFWQLKSDCIIFRTLNLHWSLQFPEIHTPSIPFLLNRASSASPGHLALPLSVLTSSWSQSVLSLCLFRLSSSEMTLKTSVSRVTHCSTRSFHQLLIESLPVSPLHTVIALKSVFSLPS